LIAPGPFKKVSKGIFCLEGENPCGYAPFAKIKVLCLPLSFNTRIELDILILKERKMARPPLEFFDTEMTPWEPHVVDGKRVDPLLQKILSYDEATGAVTLMVKYPKGFSHPSLTYHTVTEELFILQGRIKMQGKEYGTWHYAFRPPGMVHGEMEVLENDTILLLMLSGPLDYNEVVETTEK
jgi:hypothetical protein